MAEDTTYVCDRGVEMRSDLRVSPRGVLYQVRVNVLKGNHDSRRRSTLPRTYSRGVRRQGVKYVYYSKRAQAIQ